MTTQNDNTSCTSFVFCFLDFSSFGCHDPFKILVNLSVYICSFALVLNQDEEQQESTKCTRISIIKWI